MNLLFLVSGWLMEVKGKRRKKQTQCAKGLNSGSLDYLYETGVAGSNSPTKKDQLTLQVLLTLQNINIFQLTTLVFLLTLITLFPDATGSCSEQKKF